MSWEKPLLLDLFCCAGGAGMGYFQAGFEVVGVDIKPQKNYPFTFYQGDALEFVALHGHEFDAIHASPPCQGYSQCTPVQHRDKHPLLIPNVRAALLATGKPYVIENVAGARRELINPLMLCLTMFGQNAFRHRYFECGGFDVYFTPPCQHGKTPVLVSGTPKRKGVHRKDNTKPEKDAVMGINWMITSELDEAIPPAYTRFIGSHLLKHLGVSLG